MFLKQFTIKSTTVIKSTECKKLHSRLISQYPEIDQLCLDALLPSKTQIILSKLQLHNGNISNVYFIRNQPIVFSLDDVLYFTVYSLWQFKQMITYFTTWPAVFEKIANGADLMLPGVIINESSNKFDLHQPCSVCLKGNSYPVAVGTTALNSKDIFENNIEKGKAVIILHFYKDYLWALGDKSDLPQEMNLINKIESNSKVTNPNTNEFHISHCLVVKDKSSDSITLEKNISSDELKTIQNTESKILNTIENNIQEDLTNSFHFDSMDHLIEEVFLFTLKNQKNKLELPILTSTFYRNFLIPNCPQGNTIDIKQTSYKKLSKFLSSKQQEGLIQIEELTKGVDSITDINFLHDKITQFRTHNWNINNLDNSSSLKTNKKLQAPEITQVFLVSAKVQEFFKNIGKRKGDALSSQEIRQIITDYVKLNSLNDNNDIRLDALLSDILWTKTERLEVMSWPKLMQQFLNQMNEAYYLTLHPEAPILHKGVPPKIIVDVEKRAANKKVTTIQNLKQFGIDEEIFAQTIQHKVSCSASLTTDKSNIHKVVVQGNQIHHIKTLLIETYQIPVKFIVGLDKAIKPKK